MTLQEAIEQQIAKGIVDPHVICENVCALDRKWLAEAMLDYAGKIVGELARMSLQRKRQAARREARKQFGEYPSEEEKETSVWVPGKGWIAQAAMTREDCLTVAAKAREEEEEFGRKADHFEFLAAEIRRQRVTTIGELRLPIEEAA